MCGPGFYGAWGGFGWPHGFGLLAVVALLAVGGFALVQVVRGVRNPRPAPLDCPECRGPVLASYFRCPGCGSTLKSHCPSCSRVVETLWSFCPHCSSGLGPNAVPQPKGEAP